MKSAKRSEALREEMDLHRAERAAELEADAMTVEHARAEARRRFGNVGLKHDVGDLDVTVCVGAWTGCSLWSAHTGQEAHTHDRSCPDADSGRGS